MNLSLLSHLFRVERYRPRASETVGHAAPVIVEMEADPSLTPLLVSNMIGAFLPSRVSSSGTLRYAFSACPLEKEDAWFHSMVKAAGSNWGTHPTLEEALARIRSAGRVPKCVVSPTKIPVPEECSLVLTSEPSFVVVSEEAGLYTRIGDFVGVAVYRADTSLAVIDNV